MPAPAIASRSAPRIIGITVLDELDARRRQLRERPLAVAGLEVDGARWRRSGPSVSNPSAAASSAVAWTQ